MRNEGKIETCGDELAGWNAGKQGEESERVESFTVASLACRDGTPPYNLFCFWLLSSADPQMGWLGLAWLVSDTPLEIQKVSFFSVYRWMHRYLLYDTVRASKI